MRISQRKLSILSPELKQADLHYVRQNLIRVEVSKVVDLVDLLECIFKPRGSQDAFGQRLKVGTHMVVDGLAYIKLGMSFRAAKRLPPQLCQR